MNTNVKNTSGKKAEHQAVAYAPPAPSTSETPVKHETTEVKDRAKELLEFKKLLDIGAITQEEYDAKKNELLNFTGGAINAAEAKTKFDAVNEPPVSKKDNNEAYGVWLFKSKDNCDLSPEQLIRKFEELFNPEAMCDIEKENVKKTVLFKFGPDRACFNTDKTAVLMCEMCSPASMGATRNVCVMNVETGIRYNLKSGLGYRTIKEYFEKI